MPTAAKKQSSTDLLETCRCAAILLEEFYHALDGGGQLDGRSIHIGENKRYKTLARDYAKLLRKAIDNELKS